MTTRMSNLGSFEAFIPENDWSEYEERLEAFFLANDVPDKKRYTLRSLC